MFQQLRGYWPQQTDAENGVADYLDALPSRPRCRARLFHDATGTGTLTPLDTRTFRNGVVLLRYANRGGAV